MVFNSPLQNFALKPDTPAHHTLARGWEVLRKKIEFCRGSGTIRIEGCFVSLG